MNIVIKTKQNKAGEILVSGRELHEYLEVSERYSKWFDRMVGYGFKESTDYTPYQKVHPQNKQEMIDHAMKLDMAKEVSMIQRTEKGKEARQYFIEVEKQHKQQLDTSSLSPELQMFNGLFKAIANQELATQKIDEKLDSIKEIVALNTTDWRKESRLLVNKMAQAIGGFQAYPEVQKEIYTELERRANCRLSIRLTNMRNTAAGEGASKSKRDKMNKLDVIGKDKKLLEIYLAVVKDFAIKYGVWQ